MLAIKSSVTEIKNGFGGLICTLDIAEQSISELEDISKESLKAKE